MLWLIVAATYLADIVLFAVAGRAQGRAKRARQHGDVPATVFPVELGKGIPRPLPGVEPATASWRALQAVGSIIAVIVVTIIAILVRM
jgi:hypothetical protein